MMFEALGKRLKSWEVALRTSFGDDISTPEARKAATWHYHLFDHAFLRSFWHNFEEIAPGVYRSNQPTHARFERYAALGVRTVINLRGPSDYSPYLFEKESCAQLGMTLVNAKIYARRPAGRAELLHLVDVLKTAEKPFLFHCKSGAARAGLAAVLYLILNGTPVEEAMRHLSFRYVHLRWTKTGVVDHFFELYAKRNAEDPIPIERWIAEEYDPDALAASFERHRWRRP